MNSSVGGSKRQQKVGGLAALYLAAAFVVAMPFFLVFVKYPNVVDPVEKVALLVRNHDSMRVMYLITYVIFGLVLAVLALALYARLRDGAPTLAQAATVVGLIWAVVLVASGMIFNAGMAAVVELHATNPAQAVAAWQAIEPVAQGLGGSGGELLGGLWVLLVSAGRAAHRRTVQGAELARRGDRRCGCPLGRAGTQRRGLRLRTAGDRVVRVAGRRHAAHDFTSGCSSRHRRDHLDLCCRELDSATVFPATLANPRLRVRPLPALPPPPALSPPAPAASPRRGMPPAPKFLPQLTQGSARRETTGGEARP